MSVGLKPRQIPSSVRDHGGSDMELVNRGKMIECPFTGKNVYLLRLAIPMWALSMHCRGYVRERPDFGATAPAPK